MMVIVLFINYYYLINLILVQEVKNIFLNNNLFGLKYLNL